MISPLKTISSTLEAKPLLRGACCVLILLAIGCTGSSEEHDHIVYHHRPAGFVEAVTRLDEIHTAMIGQDPLPSPRQFEDTGHDDHDESSAEIKPEPEMIEVDILQEWFDVVRWFPAIAGETDLPKKQWDEINELSKELAKLVVEIQKADNAKNLESSRKKYREQEKEIGRIIQALKEKIPVHDEWKRKILNWRPSSEDHRIMDAAKGVLQHA